MKHINIFISEKEYMEEFGQFVRLGEPPRLKNIINPLGYLGPDQSSVLGWSTNWLTIIDNKYRLKDNAQNIVSHFNYKGVVLVVHTRGDLTEKVFGHWAGQISSSSGTIWHRDSHTHRGLCTEVIHKPIRFTTLSEPVCGHSVDPCFIGLHLSSILCSQFTFRINRSSGFIYSKTKQPQQRWLRILKGY